MKKINRIKMFMSGSMFFLFTLAITFSVIVGVKYISTNEEKQSSAIYKVDTNENKVALTFDIACGSSNILDILDILDKYNVKATFFLVGSWIDQNADITNEISKRGHDIGNHSNTHSKIDEISKEDFINEIKQTSNKVKAITGKETTMYRPPFGEINNEELKICESLNHIPIKWNVDSMDYKEIGPNHTIDNVLKNVDKGSIVLFHGDTKYNKQYLDIIIKELKSTYELVKLSDLVYKENYQINSSGVQTINEK